MFAEGEAPSPLAVAGKVLQVLIPRVAHAPASR
jgi:hypothetical protein